MIFLLCRSVTYDVLWWTWHSAHDDIQYRKTLNVQVYRVFFSTFQLHLRMSLDVALACWHLSSTQLIITWSFGKHCNIHKAQRLSTRISLIWCSLKHLLKIYQKLNISHLSAEVTIINIWIPSSFSRSFLYFSQLVYQWSSQCFQELSKWFWKIFNFSKLVTSVPRWWLKATSHTMKLWEPKRSVQRPSADTSKIM